MNNINFFYKSKNLLPILFLLITTFMVSCSKDSDSNEPGDIEIEFDNIAIVLTTAIPMEWGKILISIFYGITSPTSN